MTPIVIPVHNRPELTRQCVDSLIANTDLRDYQLTLVDDASTDPQTISYLKGLENREAATVIWLPERVNHGAACNRGAEMAPEATFIYFGDNDTYFTPGWRPTLIAHARVFPEVGVLGGDRHPWHSADKLLERDRLKIELASTQVGYSMLIRQELWKAYGPFLEHAVGIYGSDDVGLCDVIRSHGHLIAAVTPRVVFHTGITRTDGQPALGASEFSGQMAPEGMIRL